MQDFAEADRFGNTPLEKWKALMDRFEAMTVLLAAVDTGSLSKASRKLGLPLATVSRKVADLEAHLKADLLIRSSKGLELTPSGRDRKSVV